MQPLKLASMLPVPGQGICGKDLLLLRLQCHQTAEPECCLQYDDAEGR